MFSFTVIICLYVYNVGLSDTQEKQNDELSFGIVLYLQFLDPAQCCETQDTVKEIKLTPAGIHEINGTANKYISCIPGA